MAFKQTEMYMRTHEASKETAGLSSLVTKQNLEGKTETE
jgi:hypothetical protein